MEGGTLEEFKEFAMKGNVLDMAVGIIIGGAFGLIVATDVSNGLAALLPQIIDKLTPDGKVPEGGLLEQGLSALKQKFLGG